MKNRKLNILIGSRTLFNEKGYANVTIRMIALELKMSSGNLTYHFKKREDILEALYFKMVSAFDERIRQLDKADITLKNIQTDIRLSMERMVEYSFFWTDLYNLLRLNDKIKAHFEEAYQARFMGYGFLFTALLDKDILQKFESKKQEQFLIERMINYSNTWLYNSYLYQKKINTDYIALQSNSLLFMLYPYFTEIGKSQFKNLSPTYFD